jgi:hypothetical protein
VPFPTNKEDVLRRFVAVHQDDNRRVETLTEVMHGLHHRFLEDLAATATRNMNTTITDALARRSVSETDDVLVNEGQITDKPQPHAVLETLVSCHVLISAGDPAGYSFQHQQFQEWYASYIVERAMLACLANNGARETLKANILNQPAWGEAILFACERMAHGSDEQQDACAEAVLVAFAVDPILAAEMISRSTDSVWARVEATIRGYVGHWHAPGTVDRAMRFMISSGRPEFRDQVWPLISHQNDQVHLSALRVSRPFRPSLLGGDAATLLAELPHKVLQNVLLEIASEGGMDGLDLVAKVATAVADPDIKAAVVREFAFRRADRHAANVLRYADDATFDLLALEDAADEINDEIVKTKLAAARERLPHRGVRPRDRLHSLVYGRIDDDRDAELVAIIAKMEIDSRKPDVLLYEAQKRFPGAVAEGILRRLREGRTLPFHASRFLAATELALEDDALLDIALQPTHSDARGEAAASVLGPLAVGRMIDAMLEAQRLGTGSDAGQAAFERYRLIRERVESTRGGTLLSALAAKSPAADNHEIAEMADLISRHSHEQNERNLLFSPEGFTTIVALVEDWGNRLLDSPDTTRAQLAAIARLAGHSLSARVVPLLRRLLDEELRLWQGYRDQAIVDRSHAGVARNECSTSWTLQYQRAFEAINSPETKTLMREYLPDPQFGHSAALVLVEQWRAANDPRDSRIWKSGPDFARVAERRIVRSEHPTESSEEADAIFSVIERLVGADALTPAKHHAVVLAIEAAYLPHGQREDLIKLLLAIADRRSRCELLSNLILSGEIVDIKLIARGIAEFFEAAKIESWILWEPRELRSWLGLLAFTDRPADAFEIVQALPENHRTPAALESMLEAFGLAPGDGAENALFRFAEADPRLYSNHAWHAAVIRRGTPTAGRRFIDLAVQGVFDSSNVDQLHISSHIASLIGEHGVLRAHVYDLLRKQVKSSGLALVAGAIQENPDADGLLLLAHPEIAYKRVFTLWRPIVTKRVSAENWEGAFNVLPAPATELRRKLLAMTTDGGATDTAARCLNTIDKIRDEYGRPESEPRHPNLVSGRAWPIMTRDPDASETG